MIELSRIVVSVADALDRIQAPYAFGGALAVSYWGIVRTTQDVDCLVSLPAMMYQRMAEELQTLACQQRDVDGEMKPVAAATMRRQATARKLIECFIESVRIEFFVPVVPLQHEMLRRAIAMPFGERQIPVTTAEDMILIKLAFHRSKDLQDVRGILYVQRGRLDLDYLRTWSAKTHTVQMQEELEQLIAEYA